MLLAVKSPSFQASLRYFSVILVFLTSTKWTMHLLSDCCKDGNPSDKVWMVNALEKIQLLQVRSLIKHCGGTALQKNTWERLCDLRPGAHVNHAT